MITTSIRTVATIFALIVEYVPPPAGAAAHQPRRRVSRRLSAPPSQTSATTTFERPTQSVDELVAIQGGRLHIRRNGNADTTVLLIAGWDGAEDSWGAIGPDEWGPYVVLGHSFGCAETPGIA